MKTVFTSHELPHIWAARKQPHGRTPTRNYYFENGTIFSYGSHFPIATFVTHKGRTFCFFTTRTYSVTTSGHISGARRAVPSDVPIILVDTPPVYGADAAYLKKIATEKLADFQAKAASITAPRLRQSTRDKRQIEALKAAEDYNAYLDAFKIRRQRIDTANIAAECETARARLVAAERAAATKRKRAEERRDAELLETLDAWSAGGPYRSGWHRLPVRLRVNGDAVETSHGATLSRTLAAGAYRRLCAARAQGSFAGLNTAIGPYDASGIDGDAFIIGCHEIPFTEIDRTAEELGLTAAAAELQSA